MRTETAENRTGILTRSEERLPERLKTIPCDATKMLRDENERLTEDNKDLRRHLTDLAAEVDRLARDAAARAERPQSDRTPDFGPELASANEEFTKIEIRLTKLRRKLAQNEAVLDSAQALRSVQSGRSDRSPAVIRKNISLLIEVISGLVDQQMTTCQDLSIESKEAKRELLAVKSEVQTLHLELESLKSECAALDSELEQTNNDLSLIEDRCGELERENKALIAYSEENPVAKELSKKIDQLEGLVERLREDGESAELRCMKLKRFLPDERVHFYVESFARCQTEIRSMEKSQLKLELKLAKMDGGRQSSGDTGSYKVSSLGAVRAEGKRGNRGGTCEYRPCTAYFGVEKDRQ